MNIHEQRHALYNKKVGEILSGFNLKCATGAARHEQPLKIYVDDINEEQLSMLYTAFRADEMILETKIDGSCYDGDCSPCIEITLYNWSDPA